MSIKQAIQKSSYLSSSGTKGIKSLPCGLLAKRSHLLSYILFVEDLLGAAARDLSQKSCCLVVLHESLHACRWYDLPPVVKVGLNGTERIEGGSHTVVVSVETTVVTDTRGL